MEDQRWRQSGLNREIRQCRLTAAILTPRCRLFCDRIHAEPNSQVTARPKRLVVIRPVGDAIFYGLKFITAGGIQLLEQSNAI